MPATDGLPEELVKLFKPLCCDLCSTKINSPRSALNHYESKNHEKKTNNWLVEWSRRTGEPIPNRPAVGFVNLFDTVGIDSDELLYYVYLA